MEGRRARWRSRGRCGARSGGGAAARGGRMRWNRGREKGSAFFAFSLLEK